MNILYLTNTGKIVGGGEISLLNLLEHLDKARFKPYIVIPYEGNFTKEIRNLGIPVIEVVMKKISNPLNIYYSFKTLRNLKKIIKHYRIDLIHSNFTGGIAFLAGIASLILKIPFIWHVRVLESGGMLDLIHSILSSKIILISEAIKRRLWWIPQKTKFVVIYNGVNLKRFCSTGDKRAFEKEIDRGKNEFLVSTLGRYHPIKGYEYFIKAAKVVSRVIPNTRFLIIGFNYSQNNKYLNKLRNLAKRLNIEDRVIFMGGRKDIPAILPALDLFVLTSKIPAFERVLIEAMACAKPVVAFRAGAIPEIVIDGTTGFLAPPRDFKNIADKIIYFLKSKEIRDKFGKNGRLRAEQLFDINDHTKKIENLYMGLIRDNQR